MQSFISDAIHQSLPQNVVRALTKVAEYRGKQDLWKRQAPQILDRLQENAIIESTVASNQIEGITAPADRLEAVLKLGQEPRNRSEQELAGYKAVAESIHAYHADMRFTPNLVLQLHRDLFKFTSSDGGRWKSVDNQITEKGDDGNVIVRFQPTPAWQTAEAMQRLHDSFEREKQLGTADPILLIATYVLDFLCVHPFLDGNGRLSRLITLLLLYQAGYEVGRWISLEKTVDNSREGYYGSLHASSRGWHEGTHNLIPWWEYYSGVILVQSYEQLAARVGDMSAGWGAKGPAVDAAIDRMGPVFRISDLMQMLPGVSRPTIERALSLAKGAKRIEPTGRGRGAAWRKI